MLPPLVAADAHLYKLHQCANSSTKQPPRDALRCPKLLLLLLLRLP
jgi:hypothetical protein